MANNFKIQFKDIDSAMRAAKMFELKKQVNISVLEGKCKQARAAQKELAQMAVADFDTYKTLPYVNIKMNNLKIFFPLIFKTIKFNLYRTFCKTTPEEKELAKLYKSYAKGLTEEEKKNKTLDITIPPLF